MASADDYLWAARAQYDMGDFDQALSVCQVGLGMFPENAGLLQVSGLSAYHKGDWKFALLQLEHANLLSPLAVPAQLALARIYVRQLNAPEAALAIYDFLAEPDRCPVPALPEVVRGLAQIGANEQAYAVCLRLIELRPSFHQAHFGAAFNLTQMGRTAEQVLPFLRRAFEISPDTVSYRVSLALLYAQTERHADAYELLRVLPPQSVDCPNCVRRVLKIVEMTAEETVKAAWRLWLQMRSQPGAGIFE
jgi:tetratricopeptide (TPR) repeat protein